MQRRWKEGVGKRCGIRAAVWLAGAVVSSGAVSRVSAQQSYTLFQPHPVEQRTVTQPVPKRGPDALVTLVAKDKTVKSIVNELTRQAQLKPLYYNSPVLSRTTNVHIVNMKFMDALKVVLQSTGLEAKLLSDGETVAIHPIADSTTGHTAQAEGTVLGRVTDSTTGRGLGGVTVRVQGTKLSAVTSDSGQFLLRDVPVGDQTVSLRFTGYRQVVRTVHVTEHATVTLHIVMTSIPTVLSGVVTTATGTQQRLAVGNDIVTLNVDSLQRVAPVTSVTDLLESRVPGLTVQHTSGIPGAPSRLRLRGVGSISLNNDPIVVVDGVRVYAQQSDPRNTDTLGMHAISGTLNTRTYAAPSPLDQIDPNSIETIEVLKGPSASAMYGSDAGNGVIVITTKRGHSGPTRVSLTLDQGLSFQPGHYPTGLYRFGHYYGGVTRLCALADPACMLDSVVAFQALNDPNLSVTTGHGSTQQLSSTVSGGVSGLTYALTGSYAHYTGQLKLPNFEVERFVALHNFSPPEWMRRPDQYTTLGGTSSLNLPIGVSGGRSGTVSLTSSLFKSDQQQSSLQTAISALEGTYVDTTQLNAQPIIPDFYERATHGDVNFTNALSVNWPLTSWLPVTATGGINLMNTTQRVLTPRDYKLDADSVGYFGVNNGNSVNYTLNMNTNIEAGWVRTAIGFNFLRAEVGNWSSSVQGLPIGVDNPSSFTGLVDGENAGSSSQSSTASSTYGWFVAPTFNWHSRFFLTPGLRLDGGSASGGRVSTSVGGQSIRGVSGFPKMDFSWLVVDPSSSGSEHSWSSAVSLLRIRGAFGTAGRQPDPAAQLRLFDQVHISAVGSQDAQDIVALRTLGNTHLRPERSRELEYGFDTELWDGRLSLNVTEARKMTYDAVISVPLAPSVAGVGFASGTGIASIQQNIGSVRNTNLELKAQATLVQRSSWYWDVGGTLTHAKNVVVRLNPDANAITKAVYSVAGRNVLSRIVPGYPIDGLWTRPILGYADNNHDGVIQADEVLVGDSLQYIGQAQPKYQMTFNTNLAVLNGRLTAHTTVAYQNGMTQFNKVGANSSSTGQDPAIVLFGNDPTASLGKQAAFAVLTDPDLNRRTVYGLVQVVNTLRWQSLSINYTVPTSVARWFRMHQMMIALQGNNLGLHTNYHGKDPNVNAYSNGDITTDAGQLPQARTFDLKFILGN